MIEPIRRRVDVDGCGCLRCQGVDGAVCRRSIVGDFRESVALLRRHPSVPILVVVLTIVTGALWTWLESVVQTWPIETPIAFFLAVLSTVVRTYVGTLTLVAITDRQTSAVGTIAYSVRRLPAVVGALVTTLVVMAITLAVASMLVWGIVAAVVSVTEPTGRALENAVFDGSGATVVFGSITALAGYKFWLASEICVVGGYGPLRALRLSWIVTAMHRWRVVLVAVGFLLTAFGPTLASHVVLLAGGDGLLIPQLSIVTGSVQGLAAVVVFGVGAQIYARAALE